MSSVTDVIPLNSMYFSVIFTFSNKRKMRLKLSEKSKLVVINQEKVPQTANSHFFILDFVKNPTRSTNRNCNLVGRSHLLLLQ